jgi:hypothetical protein
VDEADVDIPAVAVCALCQNPACTGHDVTRSGVRALHRILPWEDTEGGAGLMALHQTARLVTRDMPLWARVSFSTELGIRPALVFAIASELVAITSIVAPLVLAAVVVDLAILHRLVWIWVSLKFAVKLTLAMPPTMIAFHVLHLWRLDRAGAAISGTRSPTIGLLRAAFYSCAWDYVSSPFSAIFQLFSRARSSAAWSQRRGHIYEEAHSAWLRERHDIELPHPRFRHPVWPALLLFLVTAVVFTWALVSALF